MTGRKKDTVKREHILRLLKQGCTTEAIMIRARCSNHLIVEMRKLLREEAK